MPVKKEARWRPSIQHKGSFSVQLPGIAVDRALSSGPHVDAVVFKEFNGVLGSLATKKWGWRKEKLLNVYWSPHSTQLDRFERFQNRILRAITTSLRKVRLE